jgi:hypothetical protein
MAAPDETPPESPKRINVAITPEAAAALRLVIDREGVSLTEAVRRLIGYGEYFYRAVKVDGAQVILRPKRGKEQAVILA